MSREHVEVRVPAGTSGNWEIDHFEVSEQDAESTKLRAMLKGRGYVPPGKYARLRYRRDVVMSNTPDELRDHWEFFYQARRLGGHVLVNGLGLGICIEALRDSVDKLTIVEKSEDVLALVEPTYRDDPKVEIIHADALEWKPPRGSRYTAVWHDIWTFICADNLDDMRALHRKYGRRSQWQGSWCREECRYGYR